MDEKISQLTSYTTPVDADVMPINQDSINTTKKMTWAIIKSTLKTYFDTLYASVSGTIAKATNLVGGNSTTLLGSVPYQSNTDTTTLLSPNATTTKKFLRQTGNGTNGAAPAWDTIIDGDLPAVMAGKTLTKPVINGTDPTGAAYTPATGAQTVALDCAVNNMHIVTGHASGTAITFTVANATNNQPFVVSILQGAVVSTIAGWFATVRWSGGSAPTLTATVGKRDTFGFIRTGANTYDGFVIGQNC